MPNSTAGPWLEAVEGECVASMGMAASSASVSSLGIEVRRWGRAVGIQTRRADVLAAFLARPQIYLTSLFRDRFEHAARANLERTLRQLAH